MLLETPIQTDYVGMLQTIVQPNLTAKLLHHFKLHHLRLHYFFESHYEAGLVVPGQKNFSELPLPQNITNFKTIDDSRLPLNPATIFLHFFFLGLGLHDLIERFERLLLSDLGRALTDVRVFSLFEGIILHGCFRTQFDGFVQFDPTQLGRST